MFVQLQTGHFIFLCLYHAFNQASQQCKCLARCSWSIKSSVSNQPSSTLNYCNAVISIFVVATTNFASTLQSSQGRVFWLKASASYLHHVREPFDIVAGTDCGLQQNWVGKENVSKELMEQEPNYHQSLPDPAAELAEAESLRLEIWFPALAQSMMQHP